MASVGPFEPMLPRPFRVVRTRRETHDTVTLTLAPPGQNVPVAFAPGQFNMLYAFGVGEIPVSVSGDPDEPARLLHTVRAMGAVSAALCKLKRGEVVGVRGPFGTGWPVEAGRGGDLVFMAGGIGLAPLRPAFVHALAHRRDYGRVVLIYGARSPADLLFRHELEHWRGQFDVTVRVTVDRGDAEWLGPVGVVTRLLGGVEFDPQHVTALVCGPELMMKFSALELEKRGVPADRVYLSMERNMKCAIGLCGRCQFGPSFICKDGPVFPFPRIEPLLAIAEI
jgi:NAD(P)H-flavin reductase